MGVESKPSRTNTGSFGFHRYQFFLQLKQDLFSDRLEAPYDVAVQLSSLSLQCESTFRSHTHEMSLHEYGVAWKETRGD